MTRLEVRLKRESREAAVSDSETELDLVLFRVPLTNAERGQATSKTYAVRYRDEQDITNRSELYRKKVVSIAVCISESCLEGGLKITPTYAKRAGYFHRPSASDVSV